MDPKVLNKIPAEFPVLREVRETIESKEKREKSLFERMCRLAHRIFRRPSVGYKLSSETVRTLREAEIEITGDEWLSGFLLSFLLPFLPFFILWIFSRPLLTNIHILIIGALFGGLCGLVFLLYPEARASSKVAKAQADATITVSVLAFSLYHRPDLHGALVRSSEATDGSLAKDIRLALLQMSQHRRYESLRHLLADLADKWGKSSENIRQALFDILRSSGASREDARVSDVMKAPSRVLEGSEEQLSAKLNSLILPTIAFLTFGSLLIVVVVGLSPVLGALGFSFIDLRFFIGLAASLIAVFLVFTIYLSTRRPQTIYPTILESAMRDERGPKIFKPLIPIAVFALIAAPEILHLFGIGGGLTNSLAMSLSTLWIVLATGISFSLWGYLQYSPLLVAREKEERRIRDWESALNVIGSRMLDGKSAGRSMIEASELIPGELSADLRLAGERMEKLGLEMSGAFPRKENPLIQSFISVISSLRRESEAAAGRACMTAAEFLHMLRRTERRFREKVNEALGNLWMVAIILVPVVCAMSVWVMDVISGMKLSLVSQAEASGVVWQQLMIGAMETRDLAVLRLVMGLTAIAISAIIGWFISAVKSPEDKVEFWRSVSKSVLFSSVIFVLVSLVLALVFPAIT